MISVALEGTRKVMEASLATPSVKRVVVTASVSCMIFGHDLRALADEGVKISPGMWTRLSDDAVDGSALQVITSNGPCARRAKKLSPWVPDYPKSKTLAEQLAWTYHGATESPSVVSSTSTSGPRPIISKTTSKTRTKGLEVVSIAPQVAFGPLLLSKGCESVDVVKDVLSRPIVPDFGIQVVDVRDIAECHIRAIECQDPAIVETKQRFICHSEFLPFTEISDAIRTAIENGKKKASPSGAAVQKNAKKAEPEFPASVLAPSKRSFPVTVPMWILKLNSVIDKSLRVLCLTEGLERMGVDLENGKKILKMTSYRKGKASIYAMTQSMMEKGML
ncbi:unnamed protein product [Amoebophrya sp. A25]|nr:unnamed protein product [Amoebophrya sp. A25]|eukprot:GSA25T00013184001.1